MARLSPAAAGGFLLAAFLSVTFVMRGPVTAVGPLAHEICEAMEVGWDAYGTLSALPIAAFGVFSFVSPALVRRFGLWGGIAAALMILSAGAVLRMVTNWSVLLAATLFVGAGIAILNVLMPVVVKTVWAQKSGPMMGLYTGVIGSSGAVGGLLAAPLLSLSGSLAVPFGFWALASGIALLCWSLARREPGAEAMLQGSSPRQEEKKSSFGAMLSDPLAWALTAVMGLQSLTIYTAAAWMPPFWQSLGMSASETGFWIFVYLLSGLPASVFTPCFMKLVGNDAVSGIILSAIYLAGLAGWIAGGVWLFPASVAAGASQGAMLSVAFLLMAQKSTDMRRMLGISSMAQGIGYLGAGCGPWIFAMLYEKTQAWTYPFVFFGTVLVLWGLAVVASVFKEKLN